MTFYEADRFPPSHAVAAGAGVLLAGCRAGAPFLPASEAGLETAFDGGLRGAGTLHAVLCDPAVDLPVPFDSDGDGLADAVETGSGVFAGPEDTGTDPGNPDSDGDGIADGAEVAGRTDPNSNDVRKPGVCITCPADNWNCITIP